MKMVEGGWVIEMHLHISFNYLGIVQTKECMFVIGLQLSDCNLQVAEVKV